MYVYIHTHLYTYVHTIEPFFQFLLSKYVNSQGANGKPVPWGGVSAMPETLSHHRISKISFHLTLNQMCWNYRDFKHDPTIPEWGVCSSFPGLYVCQYLFSCPNASVSLGYMWST